MPHAMSVMVNAPAVFRFTAAACPERHLAAAGWLGAETRGAGTQGAGAGDAAEVLSGRLIELMRTTAMPNGIAGVGYDAGDIPALTAGAYPQRRLLDNAPCAIDRDALSGLFQDALSYW